MTSPGGNEVGRISIRVVPDTSKFRQELRAQLEAIEKSMSVNIKAELDLHTNGIREKVHAATAGLDTKINVKLDVDKSALDKLRTVTPGGGGGNLGGGGSFGGLGSFADTAAIAAVAAVFLAPALALITGILISLPGIIAGVLTPIAAIALGLDGIKKAAEVLKQPLTDLKATMSGAFQDKLSPQFERLKTVFPLLNNEMPRVSQGLSDMAGSFIDVVTSAPGMMNIRNTIGHIGEALSAAAPGVGSFTGGLLTLADRVAEKFPALGKWFSETGTSFQNWVTKITTASNGNGPHGGVTPLETGLNSLKDTVKEILNLGGNLLGDGFKFLSDPNFGKSMKDFVADVKDLVTNVLPGLGNFFTDLSGAMHEINTMIDKLPSWMKGDGKAPKQPNPDVVPGSGNAFFPGKIKGGPLDQHLDSPWFIDAKKLKEAFSPDNLFGKDSSKGFKDFVKGFGDVLGNVNDWLSAPVSKIVDFFKNTVGVGLPQAAADVGPQIGGQLAQSLGQGLQQAAPSIGPQIQATITAATAPLQQIPAQIQQAFSGIGAAVTGSMATVVSSVAGAGSQIVAAFTSSLAQIPGIATNTFSQVAVAVQSGMLQAVAVVTAGTQQIIAALQQAASGARAAGAQVGAGMAAGIRESTGAAVAAAQALAAAVTEASKVTLGVHSPSKVFTEIGAQTAQGLQDGIDGGFQGVVDRATALAQAITDAVNNGLQGVDATGLSDTIKKQIAEIGLESDNLKVQLNGTTDKGAKTAIKDQRTQLQTIRDQLKQQQDQLGFSQKYGESLDKNDNILGDSLNKLIDAGKGFAEANIKQAASDLGISGNGAIPQALDQGLSFGMQMLSGLISKAGPTFNVNSMDEAVTANQTLTNRRALQFNQR